MIYDIWYMTFDDDDSCCWWWWGRYTRQENSLGISADQKQWLMMGWDKGARGRMINPATTGNHGEKLDTLWWQWNTRIAWSTIPSSTWIRRGYAVIIQLPSDVVMFSSKTSKCAMWQDPWPKALPKARLWSCKHLHYVYAECVCIYMFMQLYTYK